PAGRLSFMLADARVPVLLVQKHLEQKLPVHDAIVVRLDADASQWTAQPDSTPASGVGPDHTMYIIYTSGSTGQPKGVVVEARGVVNFLFASSAQGRYAAPCK